MKFRTASKNLLVWIMGVLVSFGILHIAAKFESPAIYHYIGGSLYTGLFSALLKATENWRNK